MQNNDKTSSREPASQPQGQPAKASEHSFYVWGLSGGIYRSNRITSEINDLDLNMQGLIDDKMHSVEVSSTLVFLKQALKHLQLGRVNDAIKACSKAIEIDGSCAEAYSNRGTGWNMMDMYQEAISDFDQAIKLNPRLEPALFGRGFAYVHLQKFEQGLSNFTACIGCNSEEKEYYLARSIALYHLGKFVDADANAETALHIDNTMAEAHYCRGIIKEALGEDTSAIFHYTRAIELDNEYFPAYSQRSSIYKKTGDARWIADSRIANRLDDTFALQQHD